MDETIHYPTHATTKEACSFLKVGADTLRNWATQGKIEITRTPGNHRRYNIKAFYDSFREQKEAGDLKRNIIYARVSTSSQKEDLVRQVDALKQLYPTYQVIKDVGSGINFKRKGLRTLLGLLLRGKVQEIVVAHRDRLCRFGFELFQLILSETNPEGRIVVLDDKKSSPEEELTQDLISIITVFSSRIYGLRSHKNRLKKIIEDKDPKSKDISDSGGEEENDADVIYV